MTTPINYLSTSKFQSELLPGLSYSLKKISHGRRVKLSLAAASTISRITELQKSLVPIMEEIQRAEDAAKLEPCQCNHPMDGPVVDAKKAAIASMNEKVVKNGGKPVELVDGTHSSITKRCLVDSCPCRKPMPDESIGGYGKHREIIGQIIEAEDRDLMPIYITSLVNEIHGLELDGKPATATTLLEDGPEFLIEELATEIQRLMKLTPDEAMGFKLPTISGAAVDGQALATTAL